MKLHLLPGMGADQRMFPSPWNELPGAVVHDWVGMGHVDSLEAVAREGVERWGIGEGDVLVGASLGGMVACEITKIVDVPLVVLIGSATRREEVNELLAFLHPLAAYVPMDWIRMSAGKLPGEMPQMFSCADPKFVRAMCSAIFNWCGGAAGRTKVLRIHGSGDRVIPCPESVDLALDGGHLISMTHPAACVEFVRKAVCGV